MYLVGITGGTGTGKTTALQSAEANGMLAIDADAVYHDLCQTCAPMLCEIDERFPGAVEKGVLQRKMLGAAVFYDSNALADLSAITYKYVVDAIDDMLADHAAAGGAYAAIDAINLIGTPLQKRLGTLVGVTAPEQARIARLMAREGVSEEYARLRIHAQKPDGYFETHCDHILRNDGSREAFRLACDELFKKLMEEKANG